MFGPWLETFAFVRGLVPSRMPRPHFNYITLHCKCTFRDGPALDPANGRHSTDMYLISITIIGSVIIYGKRNIDYIDALFFASGAATQSGLNTYACTTVELTTTR